jgi:hypothetical protein
MSVKKALCLLVILLSAGFLLSNSIAQEGCYNASIPLACGDTSICPRGNPLLDTDPAKRNICYGWKIFVGPFCDVCTRCTGSIGAIAYCRTHPTLTCDLTTMPPTTANCGLPYMYTCTGTYPACTCPPMGPVGLPGGILQLGSCMVPGGTGMVLNCPVG